MVTVSGEEFGDAQHAVRDAIDVRRERFGDDRDPHDYTVRYRLVVTSQPP
jgi:hypothetical protein